jgi:hypothetical protein
MTLYALIALPGLIALLFLIYAVRNVRRGRPLGGVVHGVLALVVVLIGIAGLVVASGLREYQRLVSEERVGVLHLSRVAYHEFNGVFTNPSGDTTDFLLRGDEWQVDAKVLKWPGLAVLAGFSAGYRLDRISGRYTNIDDERKLPRTVYAFHPPEEVDLWDFIDQHRAWIPWVDAFYGSATFLPMADGAEYEINITPTGLIARPLNGTARTAVSGWH